LTIEGVLETAARGNLPTRIDHVGIIVEDLQAAIDHFSERFGMVVVAREEIVAAGADVAYLAVDNPNTTDEPPTIQFLQPIREGSVMTYFNERGAGAHHVCFEVPSIEGFVLDSGVDDEQDPNVINGGRGKRTCFLRDRTFGFFVELCAR
jgi:methylmalonyl-CoA/ethylmalonyl-CoA epimerase